MSGQAIKIICDAQRAGKSEPADLHDQAGHHRYYGSSIENGGSASSRAAVGKARLRSAPEASEPSRQVFKNELLASLDRRDAIPALAREPDRQGDRAVSDHKHLHRASEGRAN